MNIIKLSLFITLYLIAMPIAAIDTGLLDVGAITGQGWKLEGVKIALGDINRKKPQLMLSATKLELPRPFHDLSLAEIRCTDFTWAKGELQCKQGRASVRSKYWQSPSTGFSFYLRPENSKLSLDKLQLAGSRTALELTLTHGNWQAKVNAYHIDNPLLTKLLQNKSVKSDSTNQAHGFLNVVGYLSGRQDKIKGFDLNIDVEQLTDQSEDGKIAADKLHLLSRWQGKQTQDNLWSWRSEAKFTGGALYADPVYLEAGLRPITLNAQGSWNTVSKQADIHAFTYKHPEAGELSGNLQASYRDGIKFDKANVSLKCNAFTGLLTTYINPFFTESPFAGISATGELKADFAFVKQALSEVALTFDKLDVQDKAGRIAVTNGKGSLNWSDNPIATKQSELAWDQIAIKGLPFKAAGLKVISRGNGFKLTEKVELPFLNGAIVIDKFSWQGKQQDEPDVAFAGSLRAVPLDQLTKTLGWTPLSGTISGRIPAVEYRDRTLKLGGEILIDVFDGQIKINNLTSSGLFSAYPRVKGDVEFANLDLELITQKIEFGAITGRISGFINSMVLENWRPITFIAWLETPDDDDSAHTINQKAVNNIASIGGGATNLLSRSFLRMFDTFRYDKIGMGCYLYKGVCQMMGLDPTGENYYLIKGGGLPRIDVVGYNSRINWDVLVERLSRLTSPDNMVVN